jgi:hypothetical protein
MKKRKKRTKKRKLYILINWRKNENKSIVFSNILEKKKKIEP